jgi:hypothetical protein
MDDEVLVLMTKVTIFYVQMSCGEPYMVNGITSKRLIRFLISPRLFTLEIQLYGIQGA